MSKNQPNGVPPPDDFSRAMKIIFEFEGGLVDDPDDPGGLTNYGISLRYNPELGRVGIRDLTHEKAAAIYRRKYWEPAGCDLLAWPLNLVVFDSAINPGPGAAAKFLSQSRFNTIPKQRAKTIIQMRRAYYAERIQENPVKAKYKRGWENRLKALERVIDAS